MKPAQCARADRTNGIRALEPGEKGIPKTPFVTKYDCFTLDAEIVPGDHLKQLIECAYTTGQGNESIGLYRHSVFTLRKRINNLDIPNAEMGVLLAFHQGCGDDAMNFTASGECCTGSLTHQTTRATAIDQA